jgi:hypothetical protein
MQQVQVAPPVAVVQEDRKAIVTALDHRLRYPRQIETWEASHAMSFVAAAENGTCRSLIPGSKTSGQRRRSEPDPVSPIVSANHLAQAIQRGNQSPPAAGST